MNSRTLKHAFSRKTILAILASGIALSVTGISFMGGVALLGLGFLGGLAWANRNGLTEALYWRDAQQKHGISRALKLKEEQALKKIQAYSERVALEVFEPALAEEIMDRAWNMVANASGQNATKELEAFIESFPPINANSNPDLATKNDQDTLARRLSQSVERRGRIEQDLDRIELD